MHSRHSLAAVRFFLLTVFLYFRVSAAEVRPDLTIMVPMRDGTELPTDIYLPHPDAEHLPCLLLRGPAGRHSPSALCFVPLAKAGYVVAIQDTRSAHDQDGKTLPFHSDAWGVQQDGYDAIEWLAKHPLTNGKIGTLGLSNMGITQILTAPTAPPSLICQYIGVAASSLYHHAIYPGGQLLKNQVEGILGLYAKDSSVLQFIIDQPIYNDFWENYNALLFAHKVQVPAIHQGGWYDIFLQGTIDAFVTRQELGGIGAKGQQKLVIGPWDHYWPAYTKLGDFTVPIEGHKPPYNIEPKQWFDCYLKGIPNEIDALPPVIYYVMGPFDGTPSKGNVWRTANSWPIPSTPTPFYLTPQKELTDKSIPETEAVISYTHDANHPAPTLGGRNLFLQSGPVDQRPIEERTDTVVFTSAPLEEDVEVTGRVIVKLVFSMDTEDTDVVVRLTDVYPDGRSILISDGLFRTGTRKFVTLDGSKKSVDVDLWSTSIVFAKGHRIRISITGSNYPRFEKNLSASDAESNAIGYHLFVGGKNLSRLILPVVK